ncbi:MAG: hypothetical protein AAF221_10485 [Pseudomonadota bacterium]
MHDGAPVRSGGFANLIVLLVVLLLSVIAAGFVQNTRSSSQMAQAHVAHAKARAAADGALYAAAFEMAKGAIETGQPLSRAAAGGQYAGRFGDLRYRVRVEAEAQKTDLNYAPMEDVQRLLIDKGKMTPINAQRLAQALEAYRRSDGYAAKQPGPLVLSMKTGLDDMAFDTVEELLALPGMSRDLFQRLAPHITVYGAPRAMEDPSGGTALPGAGSAPQSFTITVQAQPIDGAVFTRKALITFPAQNPVQFVIRRWWAAPQALKVAAAGAQ